MGDTFGDSPLHPIIERPAEFDIIRLDCHGGNLLGTHLDLTPQRGNELRRLRFADPQRLQLEDGFPRSPCHLAILDIRHRQWEWLGVEVINLEASPGAVTFVAADVLDLDARA